MPYFLGRADTCTTLATLPTAGLYGSYSSSSSSSNFLFTEATTEDGCLLLGDVTYQSQTRNIVKLALPMVTQNIYPYHDAQEVKVNGRNIPLLQLFSINKKKYGCNLFNTILNILIRSYYILWHSHW